jgi:site-specific recombinase XerD
MAYKKPHFYLRDAINDPALIILVYRFSGNRITMTTGVSIPRKYWNAKAERVKENKEFPLYGKINAMLNSLENQTRELALEFKAIGAKPSREEFKAALLAKTGRGDTSKPDLLAFIRQFIEERTAINQSAGTIKVYQRALKHLEGWQAARKRQITFEDVTEGWKNDFVAYLQAQGLADNTAGKMLDTLRVFIKEAYRRGLIADDPTAKARLSMPQKPVDNIYLSERELEVLAAMDLTHSERLDKVRDLFLIGCFTGLRFSDYTAIKPENIGLVSHGSKEVECLTVTTTKTKAKVVIPLANPVLRGILAKHGNQAPKGMTNQRLNIYLKELCKLAGFDELTEVNEYRAGKQEKKAVPKWELVSTHTARRSFATNAFKRGMAAADIMRFTGHSTMASFMKYIKVTAEESAVILADHEFFTGKSPLKAVK